MSERIEELLELLASRDNSQAYHALKALEEMSAEGDCLYPHMDEFIAMTGSSNSYIRTRGLALIARNAKWDVDGKIDGIIDGYLEHITDKKPICARQCIKLLPLLGKGAQGVNDSRERLRQPLMLGKITLPKLKGMVAFGRRGVLGQGKVYKSVSGVHAHQSLDGCHSLQWPPEFIEYPIGEVEQIRHGVHQGSIYTEQQCNGPLANRFLHAVLSYQVEYRRALLLRPREEPHEAS